MTDNDIIKALECCYIKGKTCDDCPANDFDCLLLEKMAIDLINRQKAENLSLQNKVELLEQAMKMSKEDSNKSAKSAMEVIRKQEAEIKRLECSAKQWEETARQLYISKENIKAEAIKEFAERLKEHKIDIDVSFGYGKEVYTEAVAVIEIDNLVKEMVGEEK